jgi:hypothetical protein
VPRQPDEIGIIFTTEQRERLHRVCRALRTSYVDFVTFATMQAITECEGLAREQDAIHQFYEERRAGQAD